jgi:arylsulfatase A-like enzyme
MNWGHEIAAGVEPLAVKLAAQAYRTGLFSTHKALHGTIGRIREGSGEQVVMENDQDRAVLEEAAEWFAATPSPRFLYLCLMTPHAPYVHYPDTYESLFRTRIPRGQVAASKPYPFLKSAWIGPGGIPRSVRLGKHNTVGYYVNRYDRCIRYTDDLLRSFFGKLRRHGSPEHLLTVITSDHGEGFGDHDIFAHELHLYDFLVHVPLLVRYPAHVPAGQQIREQVSVTDVVPTILGLLGRASDGLDGVDLSGPLRHAGAAPADRLLTASYRCRGFDRYMVRSNTHKLIVDTVHQTEELYDLVRDPREYDDLLEGGRDRPSAFAPLDEQMKALLAAHLSIPAERVSVPLEPDIIDELQELGYLEEDETE